jgi:hypothetical protein
MLEVFFQLILGKRRQEFRLGGFVYLTDAVNQFSFAHIVKSFRRIYPQDAKLGFEFLVLSFEFLTKNQ